MSDEDEKSGAVTLARPEEEALRLKTLAESKYTSGNLKSASKYAKRAHKLHPSLDGLPEMLAAFKILRSAAASPVSAAAQNSPPDYYKILQVERFSHINTIKKQYKKLALALHPDKNPLAASEEAFKLVGEAARVLSDKIRRKEYDMRLRIAMQEKAAEEVGLGEEGAAETFWTACSSCRLLHEFERKYLGHNLMCPRCKKSFKAVEVEEGRNNGENVGGGAGQTRVSARIKERVAKGGNFGIVEKCGLGVKRKIRSVVDVLERSGEKVAGLTDGDGVLLKDLKLKRVERVEKLGDGGVETVESERSKRAKDREEETMTLSQMQISKRAKLREEETMTLSQMQMLAKKKKKLVVGRLMVNENEVNVEKLKEKDKEGDSKKEEEREKEKENESEEGMEKEKENDREEGRQKEKEKEEEVEKVKENEREDGMEKNREKGHEKEKEKEKERDGDGEEEREEAAGKENEMMTLREQRNRRRGSNNRNVKVVKQMSKNPMHSELEKDISSNKVSLEELMVGNELKEDGKEKEKETENMREKRERRRVSKYGNSEVVKRKTSKNHVDSEMERLIAKKKGNLEIMSVEDSDFHDFDKDRRERSFKKGQVWALYDDDDGMPRHYALIDQIVSINPFEVTLSWLQFLSNGDDDLVSWQKMGFHVSCGSFMVSRKVSVKYLNLFSHVVDCERAARELYRIYPRKGSVWALYKNNSTGAEGRSRSIEDKRCYDIVISLSSYSDIHGLSVAHLEKVHGFRTVFKRKEVGANAVIYLGKNDVKLFSHQIPAKKLTGEAASGLPKDCWELDPASLTQLLIES